MKIKEVVKILSKYPYQDEEFYHIDDGEVFIAGAYINGSNKYILPREIQKFRRNNPNKKFICPECGSDKLYFSHIGNFGEEYMCEDCSCSYTLDELETEKIKNGKN